MNYTVKAWEAALVKLLDAHSALLVQVAKREFDKGFAAGVAAERKRQQENGGSHDLKKATAH